MPETTLLYTPGGKGPNATSTPLLKFDDLGNEVKLVKKPPIVHQAEIGRAYDRWAAYSAGEITPELAARVLRGDADLPTQMAVAKRLLSDPHIFACMRNLAYSVSRLPWSVLPFDEKSDASKKQAEEMRAFFKGMRWFKKLCRYLIFGEFYPFSAAGLKWNNDYTLDGYVRINPVRWYWYRPENALRLRTDNNMSIGEPINRRAYIIYEAELEPGGVRDRGLWRKVLWLWMFGNATWAYWVRFAELFGNPFIWAFFSRPEEKESVLEAVLAMDANARGVFPTGTEIHLQQALTQGTKALYEAIIEKAYEGITKVILGHQLNTETVSGAGTLAGRAAREVSQENKEGVADNLKETVQDDIAAPFAEWHYGEDAVAANEIPLFDIDASVPDDVEKKSKVYIQVNQALAPVDKAIDPEQIQEEFGVRTVDITPAAAAAEPPPGEPNDGDTRNQRVRPRTRMVAQAAGGEEPRIKTPDDLKAVTERIVAGASRQWSEQLVAAIKDAEPAEAGDLIWEAYRQLSSTNLIAGLTDVTVVGELMGRGDAAS